MDLVRTAARVLAEAGVESPETDARRLAEHVFGLAPAALRLASADSVDPQRLRAFDDLVGQRSRRVPLQYLTGDCGFRRLVLRCRPGVFIPRPETEVLAGMAIDAARAAIAHQRGALVVEPCTGTGAVALALADEVPGVRVFATDRSPDAVALATENLARLRADGTLAKPSRVAIGLGDLFEPVPRSWRGAVDVVVCNSPYLTPDEVAASAPEVREHEPADALVGGRDGNEVVRRIIDESRSWLRPDGWLLLEVGDARAERVAAQARSLGFASSSVIRDLTGRDRVVACRPRSV